MENKNNKKYMKIKIYRQDQGLCMAEDVDNYTVDIEIGDFDGLQNYLRNYLPESTTGASVWVIRLDNIEEGHPVLCYYYIGSILRYFVLPRKPCVLHDGDTVFCEFFNRERIDMNPDFIKEGSLLYRVQAFFGDQGDQDTVA